MRAATLLRVVAGADQHVTSETQEQFFSRFRRAVMLGSFVKLTLGAPRAVEPGLKNIFIRPVQLRAGLRLAFNYRFETRDILKNLTPDEAQDELARRIGSGFATANLFTTNESVELACRPDGTMRLTVGEAVHQAPPPLEHDRAKPRAILSTEPWLRELGVTQADGLVREAMGAKFRQINQFVEVLRPLFAEAFAHGAPVPPIADPKAERSTGRTRRRARRIAELLDEGRPETQLIQRPLNVVDMGCGKGYLTFATSTLVDQMSFAGSRVTGVEVRSELVEEANRVAAACGFERLHFQAGTIATTPLDTVDVLIALHACNVATDDALARGIAGGARLLVVSPCCHQELRPNIVPPPMLAPALRHGILLEREAEFVTDSIRALLLEWAGYDTKVIEFISTEHTAKNLMITALKRRRRPSRDELAARVRDFAGFYGVRSQRLATLLGFDLVEGALSAAAAAATEPGPV